MIPCASAGRIFLTLPDLSIVNYMSGGRSWLNCVHVSLRH